MYEGTKTDTSLCAQEISFPKVFENYIYYIYQRKRVMVNMYPCKKISNQNVTIFDEKSTFVKTYRGPDHQNLPIYIFFFLQRIISLNCIYSTKVTITVTIMYIWDLKKACLYKSISRGQCSINMIRQSHNIMRQNTSKKLEENKNGKRRG